MTQPGPKRAGPDPTCCPWEGACGVVSGFARKPPSKGIMPVAVSSHEPRPLLPDCALPWPQKIEGALCFLTTHARKSKLHL